MIVLAAARLRLQYAACGQMEVLRLRQTAATERQRAELSPVVGVCATGSDVEA
jgi:hypothetical protein